MSNPIMKAKLQLRIPAAILILIASTTVAPAQPAPKNAPAVNPATGLPASGGAPTIDPATGLPVPPPAPAEPQWIAPNWPDPGIVLTNVHYDDLPLSEVAIQLRDQFKNQFDILPMPKAFENDWGSTTIRLQLKDVKASDIFNAMNLVFENDRTPLRWELKMNYNRPIAQLRVLPEAAPMTPAPPKPKETRRMVFFVGNLIGDEKSGGMTMEQVVKTIYEIWPAEFGQPKDVIQFHTEAQLLVANGTREELEFINETLAALGQKTLMEKNQHLSAEMQSRVDQSRNNLKTNSGGAK